MITGFEPAEVPSLDELLRRFLVTDPNPEGVPSAAFVRAAQLLAELLAAQKPLVLEDPAQVSALTAEYAWVVLPAQTGAKLLAGANAAVNHLTQIATVRAASELSNDSQIFQAMMAAMYDLESRNRLAHGLPALPVRTKL